jgi:hypothetical protein
MYVGSRTVHGRKYVDIDSERQAILYVMFFPKSYIYGAYIGRHVYR